MNDEERDALAGLVIDARRSRYDGSRQAVYSGARVNAATLARIEAGQSVKERSLYRVLAFLWPGSGGDASRVLASGGRAEPAPVGGITSLTDEQLLTELGRRLAAGRVGGGDAAPIDQEQQRERPAQPQVLGGSGDRLVAPAPDRRRSRDSGR